MSNSTETNRIEYKEILTANLEKEVVAFLNYREGGIIFLGINNDGCIVGVDNPDEKQLQIKDRLKNNIKPSCMGLFDVVQEKRGTKENMRIFKDLNMVEQLGSGVPRILKSYSKECFIFGDSFTRMVFPLNNSILTTRKILHLIETDPSVSIRELAAKLDYITEDGVKYHLNKMKKLGRIQRIGPDKGGYLANNKKIKNKLRKGSRSNEPV